MSHFKMELQIYQDCVMTIKKINSEGFSIYIKDDGTDYLALLHAFLGGKLDYKLLNSGNADRSVALVRSQGKKYVIKRDREIDSRIEKKIMNFIFGPFFSRLIVDIDRAIARGCTVTADLYLVMEKTHFRMVTDVYTIHEYIDGIPLADLRPLEKYYPAIRSCVLSLHAAGLASNDIHAGNFILTPHGDIRIIDLSAKGSRKVCQANDLLALHRQFNIDVDSTGWVYHLIRLKEQFRFFSRKLRHRDCH
ncbi:lipopolysaccharide core heptose(II) kinase RfaY [Pectobacterium cacticida]|uniref:lipopolysaccharide core heptose(II) kinase RfaY n=1 Tax=Pectobacterium cacticida TaxID=69221 RepID=UPI0039883ED6